MKSYKIICFLAITLFASSCTAQLCTALQGGGIGVTETLIDDSLQYIWWFGGENEVVYVQTFKFTLYRSEDEGKTWVSQVGFIGEKIRWISAANASVLYFFGMPPAWNVYVSYDVGKHYHLLSSAANWTNGFVIQSILPHPVYSNYALGAGWSRGCYIRNTGGYCHQDLYYTDNFGTDWHLMSTYVNQYDWGTTSINQNMNDMDSHLYYFFVSTPDKTGNQDYNSKNWNLYRADLLHNDYSEVVYSGMYFLGKPPNNDTILFVSDSDMNGGVNLWVSEDDGESWDQGMFPMELQENGYTVLDECLGAVLVNVQHSTDFGYFGNVYASDAYGSYYTLILENNRRIGQNAGFWGAADFMKEYELDGVYVANRYPATEAVDPTHKASTAITFDLGGQWRNLTPPAFDNFGVPTNCSDPVCNLNLFGLLESVYGRFYSAPGAVGIVLATGNVGEYLKNRVDEVNTYMTRNGGVSWHQVSYGSLTYEISDHGALLVFANNTEATNNLLYTWNEGENYTQCQFTTAGPMQVVNIVVEPTFTSQKFILYGRRGGNGVLVSLDFSGLHERQCVGADQPGTPGSDYYLWSPSDVITNDTSKRCLLGRHMQYTRRRSSADCFNPLNYEPQTMGDVCLCTRADYQCDYCYEDDGTGNCGWVCGGSPNPVPSPCQDYYFVSKGYRLIPGNVCDYTNGLNMVPVQTACPGYTGSTGSTGSGPAKSGSNGGSRSGTVAAIVIVILLVIGIAVGIGVSYKLKKPEALWSKCSGGGDELKYSKVRLNDEEQEEPLNSNQQFE